jgi:hypothetical protein
MTLTDIATRPRRKVDTVDEVPLRFCKRIAEYPYATGDTERRAKAELAYLLGQQLERQEAVWGKWEW